MSLRFHAVVRGDNLTGWGYRPDRTPAHQVDFETGISANTCGSRMKYDFVFVSSVFMVIPLEKLVYLFFQHSSDSLLFFARQIHSTGQNKTQVSSRDVHFFS